MKKLILSVFLLLSSIGYAATAFAANILLVDTTTNMCTVSGGSTVVNLGGVNLVNYDSRQNYRVVVRTQWQNAYGSGAYDTTYDMIKNSTVFVDCKKNGFPTVTTNTFRIISVSPIP
ncbi:hypothetical protein VXS12_16660 [Acinetobacter baumannii]|uniref:hypothetical protein n=1 Tax=Acinetobacter baumannii TaxID=470 RepID=UPI0023406B40|nr:hypothetical protein [Acinetobacter baumannii]MDC4547003.1 hypothetical protein [Acinetobacter baumannii]MDC4955741.1 hypothetical protein [Acinetobacter baumannii]MEC6741620.1 hypothetical protein [Acinetobacter baumannii]